MKTTKLSVTMFFIADKHFAFALLHGNRDALVYKL